MTPRRTPRRTTRGTSRHERRERPLVVVGDALLDQDFDGSTSRLAPDAPVPVVDIERQAGRPGGAALAAALAARDGREVLLLTALGDDPASRALRELLPPGVRPVPLPLDGELPVKSRVRVSGRPLARIDRGGGTPGRPGPDVHDALHTAGAVLVADYGRGTATALRPALAAAAERAPLVWDPHPRGDRPVAGASLVTPNDREAQDFARRVALHAPPDEDQSLRAHSRRGALLADHWRATAVAVTLAERGVLLTRAHGDDPLYVPVTACEDGDPCGAGDCFAATAAMQLADEVLPARAVERAAWAAAGFVTSRGADDPAWWYPSAAEAAAHRAAGNGAGAGPGGDSGGGPGGGSGGGLTGSQASGREAEQAGRGTGRSVGPGTGRGAGLDGLVPTRPQRPRAGSGGPDDGDHDAAPGRRLPQVQELAAGVRRHGGSVVATGGCFDLLHAGHVELLQNARRTGDLLVVLVNSDDSVRRLKGPGRPLNSAADRMRVLAGLDCVDAVLEFPEDTPERLLRALRPELWVKGGDYGVRTLPEAAALREWGGQVLVLPYLDGRSTTALADRAAHHTTHPPTA